MQEELKRTVKITAPSIERSLDVHGLPASIACTSIIGRGGMGVVYRATHLISGAELAVKLLLPAYAVDKDNVARFMQEARTLCRLADPHIVTVHDCGLTDQKLPYIVMDYVPGVSLQQKLDDVSTLSAEETIDIFTQCARGLDHAHKHNVVHRDLKPGNIMLSTTDSGGLNVKVLDFGIAKEYAANNEINLTATGEVLGTPCYMSPEQTMGQILDGRSDIYALGCVMYEALTGKPPFDGTDAIKILAMQVREKATPIEVVRPELPPALCRVVMRCLEKRREDRYPEVTELISDLQLIREEKKVPQRLSGEQKYHLRQFASTFVWALLGFVITYVLIAIVRHFFEAV